MIQARMMAHRRPGVQKGTWSSLIHLPYELMNVNTQRNGGNQGTGKLIPTTSVVVCSGQFSHDHSLPLALVAAISFKPSVTDANHSADASSATQVSAALPLFFSITHDGISHDNGVADPPPILNQIRTMELGRTGVRSMVRWM